MTLKALKDRVWNDLLPTFCDDPSRGWGRDGFKADWGKLSDQDAIDFLRALDAGLVEHQGRGLYRAPMSKASEQFFWSGSKKKIPRPITIWIEPIITVAMISRLHFNYRWPIHLIGAQSIDWAFDIVCYRESDFNSQYIACEVKKTSSELDRLIKIMHSLTINGVASEFDLSPVERNAFRKNQDLKKRRAPIFCGVGPNGMTVVFRVEYAESGAMKFVSASDNELRFPG